MQTATHRDIEAGQQAPQQFPTLESVTRPTVGTAAAAFYLNRRPQTLRHWAMNQHPIRPLRINGRLHWKTEDIRRLLSKGGV